MAFFAGAVTVDIDADTKGLKKGVEESKTKLSSLGGFAQLSGNALKSAFAVGVVGTGLLAGGLGFAGKAAIDNSAQFETFRATLTTMLGSQELANDRLREYADIGAKTPFELPQVVALGNQLQALGRYSRDNVNMLGDLASAAGKPIEQVSGAFAKLASGQKGIAVDMFRDLLITTEDWTKATGKGISKSGELMATTEEMMAVLPKIMKDKKFLGMMEQQSQTFIGKMSNLMDAWNAKLREVGEKILPIIKPYIDKLINVISSIDIDSVFSNFNNLFNLLFRGDYTGGIFGLEGEDNPIIGTLFNIGESARNLHSILFRGDYTGGIFGLEGEDNPIIGFLLDLRDNAELGKAILVGLAGVIGTLVVGAFATMAVSVISATAPFLLLGAAAAGLYYAWQTNFGGIRELTSQVFTGVRLAIDFLKPAFFELVNSIQPFISELQKLWGVVSPFVIPTLRVLGTVLGVVVVGSIFVLIKSLTALVTYYTSVVSSTRNAIQSITVTFNSLRNINLYDIGRNIMQGLINGLNGLIGSLKNKIAGIANLIPSEIKSVLGIRSPSIVLQKQVMEEGVGPGLINPLETIEAKIKSRVSSIGQSLIPEIQPSSAFSGNGSSREKESGINITLNLQSLIPDQKTVYEVVRILETELNKRFRTI
jgi:hypothetical protein